MTQIAGHGNVNVYTTLLILYIVKIECVFAICIIWLII